MHSLYAKRHISSVKVQSEDPKGSSTECNLTMMNKNKAEDKHTTKMNEIFFKRANETFLLI